MATEPICKIGQPERCKIECEWSRVTGKNCKEVKDTNYLAESKESKEKPKDKRKHLPKDSSRRRSVYRKGKGICHICNEPVEYRLFTIDHVIPRSKGGSNTQENLKPAHWECNNKKADKLI